MGKLPDVERKYQIQEMWSVHHEITRLLLIGMKEVDIARQLSVTPAMVSYTKNSAVVKRQLALLQGARDLDAVDISQRIKELLPKAVDKLEELLDNSQNESIQYKVAADVLDRGGHGAVKMFQGQVAHAVLTKQDIDEIKQRAKEIGICVTEDHKQQVIDIHKE